MTRFRWGIFGTGDISAKFVAGLAAAREAEASFVASRSLAKAKLFADGMRVPRAVEGYEAAAAAGGVDAIYIATPPSMHAEHARLCIEAGFPVLIEKPFATSEGEAQRIVAAARESSVFAMEAMWTRFLPAAEALRESIATKRAGEIQLVAGSFGTSRLPDPTTTSFSPALGGGAMSQLGVYPLSLAQWLFGSPEVIEALGSLGTTGVDEVAAFQLRYPGDVIGSFFATIRAWAPNDFRVMGTDGSIEFHGPIVRPFGLEVSRRAPLESRAPAFGWRARIRQHSLTHRFAQLVGLSSQHRGRRLNYRYAGNGYNYEADEVRACVERGATESPVMPLDESIAVASTANVIRTKIREAANASDGPS